jgi:hypothetical protein
LINICGNKLCRCKTPGFSWRQRRSYLVFVEESKKGIFLVPKKNPDLISTHSIHVLKYHTVAYVYVQNLHEKIKKYD